MTAMTTEDRLYLGIHTLDLLARGESADSYLSELGLDPNLNFEQALKALVGHIQMTGDIPLWSQIMDTPAAGLHNVRFRLWGHGVIWDVDADGTATAYLPDDPTLPERPAVQAPPDHGTLPYLRGASYLHGRLWRTYVQRYEPEFLPDLDSVLPDIEALRQGQVVGITEIAHRAGVKPDTVHKWRRRHADFPSPVANLASGPIWRWGDVAAWLARERKPGRPRNV